MKVCAERLCEPVPFNTLHAREGRHVSYTVDKTKRRLYCDLLVVQVEGDEDGKLQLDQLFGERRRFNFDVEQE